ncbi:D-serine ammonia-lyase [Lysinibacillus boronitolerans]|uniref:Probable D-serine dehydratase n=1 Tax=Lysinibacillus boronitolerans JCM 21713 = 10a = NBRC 103108 TaxID=1294264 RepID=A0ABR4Y1U8_9BACI|nr:D-serine ammonia-lyase [Lysinibacillus boronitolerans]KGR87455.1 serine ammonia-lyase [Lysinibacillus boronitolerans JCM 21713 = 10a = NBRC 103108]
MKNEHKHELFEQYPQLNELANKDTVLWENTNWTKNPGTTLFTMPEVDDAEATLQRFSSYLKVAFPELLESEGLIESTIKAIPTMKNAIEQAYGVAIPGQLLLKCDHALPISGSIKARGGIYEVLKHAERLALASGRLKEVDDYAILATEEFQSFFQQYTIAVGSTGNLGLSIGIMGKKLGFNVVVHMSSDAKEWKKALLREKGATVIEYEADYSVAVEQGRQKAEQDPKCHFIDDENSKDLFAGYAVAAKRLKGQLERTNITVDEAHPLFVYLPCGVGGGPGGVAYGLKEIYGEHVHIFFAEPVASPCMTIGLMTGLHDAISVEDIGLDNRTEADGLAVGRASKFVGKVMETYISGCYTVSDEELFTSLGLAMESEDLFLEPSAHAGMFGAIRLLQQGQSYLEKHALVSHLPQATHLVWATGGSMVPPTMRAAYLAKAKEFN